jgi:hypothetical protein
MHLSVSKLGALLALAVLVLLWSLPHYDIPQVVVGPAQTTETAAVIQHQDSGGDEPWLVEDTHNSYVELALTRGKTIGEQSERREEKKSQPKKTVIGFLINHLDYRGTGRALYDYAELSEK